MLRAIQPRSVRLDCIEEQNALGAIPAGVGDDRNPVARPIGGPIPSSTEHEADARSLDIPRSDRGRVRVTPNRDHDMAVRVLPPILLHDPSIRHILGHIERCARMMSEGRTSRSQQGYDGDNQAEGSLPHPSLAAREGLAGL
jgi:hypothetical protein